MTWVFQASSNIPPFPSVACGDRASALQSHHLRHFSLDDAPGEEEQGSPKTSRASEHATLHEKGTLWM